MRTIRVGSGAGFADDRIEPAAELAEHGQLDYLVFECLAERTIALAQRERRRDPRAGFNAWLAERMDAVLGHCARQGIRIVTNMGAANPLAAAELVADLARRTGLPGLKVAAVTGDDVLDLVAGSDLPLLDRPGTVASLGTTVISANAAARSRPRRRQGQRLRHLRHRVRAGRLRVPACAGDRRPGTRALRRHRPRAGAALRATPVARAQVRAARRPRRRRHPHRQPGRARQEPELVPA
jgi:hypothetical protein